MKKTLTLLTLALTILSFDSEAQIKAASIQGKVVDSQKKPAEAITVSLLFAKDSTLASQSITDKTGSYSFQDLRSGQYLVQASSVGSEKVYSSRLLVTDDQPEIEIPAMTIVTSSKELGNVTVVGRRPFIEQKMDKIADRMKHGYSLIIFPEGTRSEDGEIGRFHKGAFYLAEKLDADILPIMIHGTNYTLTKKDALLKTGR